MSNHMKRLNSPSGWRVAKKINKFVAKTSPGPHNKKAMPMAVWLRDHMGLALNMKEAKKILKDRSVLVNGVVCTDPKLGIGVFDIVAIPKTEKYYRILRNKKGDYVSVPISAEDASTRLCKISDKTIVKGGTIQLNLRYGANIVVDTQDYKPKDSVVLTITGDDRMKVVDHFSYSEGNCAMIIGGSHSGKIGKISRIDTIPGSIANRVYLKDLKSGEEFDTIEDYIFMVGASEPAVSTWGIEE
ncbi:small subunit ribosomal protein S4e [Methanomicrobium sp. W14]|jgi:small subunit ribosomal protein S4e|uniref:30S ribosomal protein S4e n=1 Tax=Methanomicrobium sp. W14 TaxID=2817839 RepID=UPI001AE74ED6|nr:30S ribosomal protein S4e [Methanomicrobium sp. W14]MBP2133159.1 small subunit ribosomal protein S4e [Methanomicrobium sp. W14]